MQWRLRDAAMEAGVTMLAPETVFLCADTKFGRDVTVEPNVVFGPGCVVEDAAVIHAFSHLEGAHVGKGASVGPFARLRRGAKLAAKSRVGNFVEVKEAEIVEGAKANHLAYIDLCSAISPPLHRSILHSMSLASFSSRIDLCNGGLMALHR